MRGSKWDSVKPVLRTLQESFSASIHTALLIKPDTFWQKHKTNLGSAKLSFEVPLQCNHGIVTPFVLLILHFAFYTISESYTEQWKIIGKT